MVRLSVRFFLFAGCLAAAGCSSGGGNQAGGQPPQAGQPAPAPFGTPGSSASPAAPTSSGASQDRDREKAEEAAADAGYDDGYTYALAALEGDDPATPKNPFVLDGDSQALSGVDEDGCQRYLDDEVGGAEEKRQDAISELEEAASDGDGEEEGDSENREDADRARRDALDDFDPPARLEGSLESDHDLEEADRESQAALYACGFLEGVRQAKLDFESGAFGEVGHDGNDGLPSEDTGVEPDESDGDEDGEDDGEDEAAAGDADEVVKSGEPPEGYAAAPIGDLRHERTSGEILVVAKGKVEGGGWSDPKLKFQGVDEDGVAHFTFCIRAPEAPDPSVGTVEIKGEFRLGGEDAERVRQIRVYGEAGERVADVTPA